VSLLKILKLLYGYHTHQKSGVDDYFIKVPTFEILRILLEITMIRMGPYFEIIINNDK